MSAFRFAVPLSLLLTILLWGLPGCAPTQPGSQSGTQYAPLTADPEHAEPGPFPTAFRDLVIEHIADTYPGDRVLRNIVVRPPFAGVAPVQGVHLAGFIGSVRMSLKDDERQAYVPVEYCYFLREEQVLAFADARDAGWCTP